MLLSDERPSSDAGLYRSVPSQDQPFFILEPFHTGGFYQYCRRGGNEDPFVCYYRMRLVLGHDLTRIALAPKHPRQIASEAELLALRPELQFIE